MVDCKQDEPELMTVREAARYLQVSSSIVYEACRCNKIPYIRVLTSIRIPRRLLWEAVHEKNGL